MDKLDRKQAVSDYKEKRSQGCVYAIRCGENKKLLLQSAADRRGAENRFAFAQSSGGCIHLKLQKDWTEYGPAAFSFEALEELEQGETQSPKEFRDDLKALEELWRETLLERGEDLY